MNTISNIFSGMFSSVVVTEGQAKAGAKRVRQQFGRFQKRMKTASRLLNDRSKAVAALNQFNQVNSDIPNDQSVSAQKDIRRAYLLLILTFLFESFLSYKGAQFLLETFLAVRMPIVTIVVAVVVAAFAIMMSINIRHFANRYKKDEDRTMYYATTAGAYLLVLIVPIANVLEGFNTLALNQDGLPPQYQTLNILVVLLTLGVHITLINMSEIIIDAENAKKAGKLRVKKTKDIADADKAMQDYSVQYEASRQEFTETVRDFMPMYLSLRESNPNAAQRVLNHLDVYLIWVLNRIYGHAVLPYHANAEGQIQSNEPFSAELRRMADLMERMDTITVATSAPVEGQVPGTGIGGQETGLPEAGQPEPEGGSPSAGTRYDREFGGTAGSQEQQFGEGGVNPRDKEL